MIRIIKKSVSLLASAFIVLVVSGFISLHPISQPPAYAQGAPAIACDDMSMAAGHLLTDPYLAGQTNAGQFNFNLPANIAFQACSRNSNIDAGGGVIYNPIEGWVWNTNLGDISFYCNGGLNAGVACGKADPITGEFIDYGARYILADNKFDGFAWGDNVGWISLNCQAGSGDAEFDPDTGLPILWNSGVRCGSISYGVKVATANGQSAENCNNMTKGDLYGYAYSESTGYMNFCGAKVSPQPIYTATLSALDAAGAVIVDASGATVNANGVDSYKIKVQVLANGLPVQFGADGGPINIALTGLTNTVKTDQVTCGQVGQNCVPDAITQPVFVWDAATSSFISTITSLAPTNPATGNAFAATGVTVTVKNLANVTVREIPKDLPAGFAFNFMSLAEVDKVLAMSGNSTLAENSIPAAPNDFQDISFNMIKRGTAAVGLVDASINVISQIYDCTENYDFFFDQNGNKIVDADRPDEAPIDPNEAFPQITKPGMCSANPNPGQGLSSVYPTTAAVRTASFYTAPQDGGNPALEEPNAVALQTIISYTLNAKSIRYFSKAIMDGSISNQVANIKGNVRLDIFDTSGMPANDKVTESLGQRAQSRRTVFSKAIKGSLSGKSPTLVGEGATSLTINNISNGISYYKRNKAQTGDKPCAIIIDSGDNPFSNTGTIVADGCDVFIDNNLMANTNPNAGPLNARFGIIALEDLTLPSAGRRGGNVYICGKVTDVEANMVLDNSLFSYGVGAADCGGANKTPDLPAPQLIDKNTGYPVFAGIVKDVLKNQLNITGSIVGNNTYGGSLLNPPLLGNGGEAITQEEKAAARLFDLNFMRYAKTVPGIDEYGDPVQCWAADVKCSKAINEGSQVCDCILDNASYNSIVSITYRGPAPTQPIFNLVEQK